MSVRRRWLQFRLSTLLLVIAAFAACLAIVVRRPKPVQPIIRLNEKDTWAEMGQAGGSVGSIRSKRASFPRHGECIVSIDRAKPDEPFSWDFLKIVVRSMQGVPIAQYEFESSYGVADLDLIDLDADRNPEFVLITGEGRGSGARWETLTVLTLNNTEFHRRLMSPSSGMIMASAQWRYQREYYRTAGGPIEIHMTLQYEGAPIEHFGPNAGELLPVDNMRVLSLRRR